MNIAMLTFVINDHEKIIIPSDEPDDIVDYSYLSKSELIIHDQVTIIGSGAIGMHAVYLQRLLKQVIADQLPLHESIKNSIGYYYNQDLNEEHPDIFLIQGKESKYWIGSQYLLWTTDSTNKNKQFATWLYNDIHGNIVLEVTPIYPEDYVDPKDPADVKAYQDWMETSYKPFFTRIIPKEIAMKWLDQANLILTQIKDNTEMLKAQYEAENKDINLK